MVLTLDRFSLRRLSGASTSVPSGTLTEHSYTNTSTAPRTAAKLRPDWSLPGERLSSHSTSGVSWPTHPLWRSGGGRKCADQSRASYLVEGRPSTTTLSCHLQPLSWKIICALFISRTIYVLYIVFVYT